MFQVYSIFRIFKGYTASIAIIKYWLYYQCFIIYPCSLFILTQYFVPLNPPIVNLKLFALPGCKTILSPQTYCKACHMLFNAVYESFGWNKRSAPVRWYLAGGGDKLQVLGVIRWVCLDIIAFDMFWITRM